jgi:hypothetical protein
VPGGYLMPVSSPRIWSIVVYTSQLATQRVLFLVLVVLDFSIFIVAYP